MERGADQLARPATVALLDIYRYGFDYLLFFLAHAG
jgi:hypothetical protein